MHAVFKQTFFAGCLAFCLTVLAQPVLGQSPRPVRENMKQTREEMRNKEFGQARADARCANATARINARTTTFNNRKARHIERYQELRERLVSLIQKLDEKGYDVATVRADLSTLDEKIKKAASDYATFIAKLETSKQFDCADSEGRFKAALEEARAALSVFRADIKDIQAFLQNTLRPHLKALRDQKPATDTAELETTSERTRE